MLPEDIYVACQNSSTSVTIGGPLEKTKEFVEELISKGIFARNVESDQTAFHTKHISPTFPYAFEMNVKTIPSPKPRSSKWISTSVPKEKAEEPWAKLCCGEYYSNNYSSTVLFDQVFQYIPKNAIVVEVAPRDLLKPILMSELGPNATVLSVTSKRAVDHGQYLLSAIGK